MLVVMSRQASEREVRAVVERIEAMGLKAHPMPGPTRTAIGITGNTAEIDPTGLSVLPGVRDLIRVTKPFKLASREMHIDDSIVRTRQTQFGPGTFTIIAGPCSVENEDMILRSAEFLVAQGVKLMRAGAFKPRTSPYSFQGLEDEGLRLLEKAREATGIGIVTEVLDIEHVSAIDDVADLLQVGTRNMQNFPLLKRLAKCKNAVMLKRGMAATMEEWLMAAEYLLVGGNANVVLCERGVRTFADHTRNTLDLSIVPPIKELSHLPIIVDPSHGTGRAAYVPAMSLAGLAAGADGLMIEVHPDPANARSDGLQSLDFDQLKTLMKSLRQLAEPVGRTLV